MKIVADNFDYVLFPALASMMLKEFSGVGEEAGIPSDGNNNTPIDKPSTPIGPPNINYGGSDGSKDGLDFGNITGGRDFPYAYEPEFWGGTVPDNIGNAGLWGDVKTGLKSASSYLGIFGNMLSGGASPLGLASNIKSKDWGTLGLSLGAMAPTTPLGVLGPLLGTMLASPTSRMNPMQDPTIRNGLINIYSKAMETNVYGASKYGKTAEDFTGFIDGVFGTGNSFSPKVTPQAEALFGMVGITGVNSQMLLDLRTNSMNTARSISMDLQSYNNPNIIGFSDLSYLNALSPALSSYAALTPDKLASINDLANTYGLPSSSISYSYKLNPDATKIKLGNGDVQGVQSTNNHLGYLDTTQGLTRDYKAGLISFDEWGNKILEAKNIYDNNENTIDKTGTYGGNVTYSGVRSNSMVDEQAGKAAAMAAAYGVDSGDGGNTNSRGNDATGTGTGTGSGVSGNLGGSAPGRDWG